MLNACRRIQRYGRGVDGTAFLDDELRQDAIIRQLTILGEAAKRLSPNFRMAYPEIPWQQISGFRDVVVHLYEGVELTRVRQVVTEDLVSLTAALASLLSPERP